MRRTYARVVGSGEGVSGLGARHPADGAEVAGHHGLGWHQRPAEGVRQGADLLVLVVVLVPQLGAEEGREVAGHVHRGVRQPGDVAEHLVPQREGRLVDVGVQHGDREA